METVEREKQTKEKEDRRSRDKREIETLIAIEEKFSWRVNVWLCC